LAASFAVVWQAPTVSAVFCPLVDVTWGEASRLRVLACPLFVELDFKKWSSPRAQARVFAAVLIVLALFACFRRRKHLFL
jgi:hypothetical protein